MRSRRVDAGLLLFLTPVLWGVTFPAAKCALETLPLYPFMAWTRGLGFVTILVLLPWIARGTTWEDLRTALVPGAVLGSLMFTGYTLQTAGLERTTATNAGFITGLYIVFTPLLGLVPFKERVPRAAWIAVGLSVAGLALLSVTRFSDIHPRLGDLLVLAGALAWGGHLTALGRLSPGLPAVLLSLVQMGTAAGLHVLASAGGGLRTGEAMSVWPLLIITGVVGSGVAFTFQVVAQQEISPMRAAIILAGESLVAAAAAAIWLGERLSFHQWIGAGLIVGAMVLSELGARRSEAMRLEPGSAL